MEGEKIHNDGEQHEIDRYFKNAVIENESEYPELKSKREEDRRVFEHSYPDNKSRYKGALAYLGGDFFNVFAQLAPPAPEEGEEGWRFIQGSVHQRKNHQLSKLGYIDELYVKEEARGQGVAKNLFSELESEFKKQGCDHITTHTDFENELSQQFYLQAGMHKATIELWKEL